MLYVNYLNKTGEKENKRKIKETISNNKEVVKYTNINNYIYFTQICLDYTQFIICTFVIQMIAFKLL